jgi:maleylpyruvate isomerase
MFDPDQSIDRLHQAQDRLLGRLAELTDEIVARPSLLPGWSVGHVLTHIARNGDSVVRRLEGAARDEVVDQYPGGKAARDAEIEAGATRSAVELVADVRASNQAVIVVATKVPGDAWQRLSRSVGGGLIPAEAVLSSRIREVEIHHVDLGLGYGPHDWPDDFVTETLTRELAKLPVRTDPAQLLGWLIGREPAPDLPPWS